LIITVNTHLETQWRQAAARIGSAAQVSTLSYGIDGNLVRFRSEEKVFDVAFFGRVDSVKGADLLPDILKGLWSRDPGIRFVVIGGGVLEQKVRHRIEKMHGANAPVTWTGNLRGDERLALLAKSRVMCNPTREDSFSIAVAESLAVGVPVVASDNPHLRAVYGDALLYDNPDDASAFACRIVDLLSDEQERKRRVDQGITFAAMLSAEGNVHAFRERMQDGL
jgi:glycosyltransferase involved in cell wall biosynthesis